MLDFKSSSMFGRTKLIFGDFVIPENSEDIFLVDGYFSKILGNSLVGKKVIYLEGNENTKEWEFLGEAINKIIGLGLNKKTKILAIGGGAIQDLAGFLASCLHRGIDWHFVPTTLASQADSCVGSKTSINVGKYKNIVGSFWSPSEIYIDHSFLKTLSLEQRLCGLGEILHYKFLDSSTNMGQLRAAAIDLTDNKIDRPYLIHDTIKYKLSVVELDEKDTGIRRLFNFGHTFGHALEAATNFNVKHGIAVILGMKLAFKMSEIVTSKYNIFTDQIELCDEILRLVSIPKISKSKFLNALELDKKNTKKGCVTCILSNGIGSMFIHEVELSFIEKQIENIFETDQLIV